MSGNQALGFAIRAVNEAGGVLKDVAGDIAHIGEVAAGAVKDAANFSTAMAGIDVAAGGISRGLDTAAGALDLFGSDFAQQAKTLADLSQGIGVLAEDLGGLTKQFPEIKATLMGLPATLAGAATATWGYVTALYAQAVAFVVANAPIILLVAGIAALVAGIILLITHWDDIKPHLQPVVDFFNDTVVPAAQAVWEKGLKPIIDFVRDHWPEIVPLLTGPFAPVVLLATDGFGIRSAMVGAITGLFDDIVSLGGRALDAGKDLGGKIKDGIVEGFGAIADRAGDMAAQLVSALKAAWNNSIGWADEHFKLHIPGVSVNGVTIIPDVDWDPDLSFLKLAQGGIVTRPTFAMIGEAGPEAVIPLSGAGARGMGNTYNIYALDARSFEDWLNRTGGAVLEDWLERRRSA